MTRTLDTERFAVRVSSGAARTRLGLMAAVVGTIRHRFSSGRSLAFNQPIIGASQRCTLRSNASSIIQS